ncbi:hypothetical protein FBU31_006330 [Coemansia sp. 'formosensis']|nr:hypothetical protein FBU31_006330 [Coemansia sp. 'formosensis']
MESSNIYVYHRGNAKVTSKKSFLLVFPYSENLTMDVMVQHAITAFGEKQKKLYDGTLKYHAGWFYNSVLSQCAEQPGHKKAIMTAHPYFDMTYIDVYPLTRDTARRTPGIDNTNLESRMDELIKHYETITADAPATKVARPLTAKNIFYYDERKVPGYTFDKRSPEGVEFIKAKLVSKREKLVAQRTHSANAKRRDQCIEVSRQSLQGE